MQPVAAPTLSSSPAGTAGGFTPAQQVAANPGNNNSGVPNPDGSGNLPVANPNAAFQNNQGPAALIATSAPSRAATATNTSTLNTINSNIANTNANPPAPVTPPVTPTPATTNTSATSNNTSTSTPTTSTYTPPAGYTALTMANGNQGFYNQSTQQMVDSTGKPLSWNQQQNAWIDPSTGQVPVAPTTAPAGTGTSTTGAGSPPGLVSSTDLSSAVSQLPPSLQGLYTDSITAQNASITSAYNTVQAATTTYNNAVGGTDPAMLAAAQQIQNKYAVLIQQMQAKNAQVVGRASTAASAYGGLGQMSQDFMNDETSAATARVGNLTTQMNDLILKSNQAYQTGDLKVLNDSINSYNQANTAQQKAISDLLTAVSNNVKENQAQQKIDAASAKTQNTQDISNSVKGAAGALSLAESNYGVTDPSQLTSDQLNDLASTYGVSDPAILLSQMTTTYATNQKNALNATNVQSEITDRDSNAANTTAKTKIAAAKAAAGPKVTGAQNLSNATAKYQSYLQPGVKLTDGTPIMDTTDGSSTITPGAWKQLIAQAPADGLTRQQFIKAFGQYVADPSANAVEYGLNGSDVKLITGATPTP